MDESIETPSTSFESRMMNLPRGERQTAKAMKERGLEAEFEFPEANENEDEAFERKLRNAATLNNDRCRQYRNPTDPALSQQRHEAERARDHQRLQDHADRQKSFRNPANDELSQQRHARDATRQHTARLPGL